MRKILVLATALLINSSSYALPASQESVETLLEISGAESISQLTYVVMDQVLRVFASEQVKAYRLNADQQRQFDAAYAKLQSIIRPEFSWKAMKPRYVQIYQETFDQQEIDGLIALYRSPVGVAYVAKSPALTAKLIKSGAEVAVSLMPKLGQAAADSAAISPLVSGSSCPTQVPPTVSARAFAQRAAGVVRATATVLKGAVTEVKIISGPEIFHESVIAALKQYKCSYSEVAFEVTQEFSFRMEGPSPAAKTP